MNVRDVNEALLRGGIEERGVLPHLEGLAEMKFQFAVDFGLNALPEEPGIIMVRGARQYGKSTWLEQRLKETIKTYGPGSAFYLNGDTLRDADHLLDAIRQLVPMFARKARVRRLFIDEVTSVRDWALVLKRLVDARELTRVLVVTTGSNAHDLRRGVERLPGRKGKLARTEYLFTPISYRAFHDACADTLGDDTLVAYAMSGGSPVALASLASRRQLPQYVIEIVRDWIYGACAASGRPRSSLVAVMEAIDRRGGTPIGQAKLAREAGLANNTVAAGYVELLADLNVLGISHAWDPHKGIRIRRRPAKFPMINLLAAIAWSGDRIRTINDFRTLDPQVQGKWWEWLIAQELWRRAAIAGHAQPEQLRHWISKEHELDFVLDGGHFIEVKRGSPTPFDFSWFPNHFPNAHLTIVSNTSFETDQITALSFEDFLL